MIRSTLLWMFVAFLAAYSWRDWYKSLCGLILLMAVIQHPDFPKSLMGVQGVNPWNILLAVIVLAWAASRGREGLKWDMPGKVRNLLIIYFLVIIVSFLRMLGHLDVLEDAARAMNFEVPSLLTHFSEQIVNCLKWVVPGLLLYDGCRSEQRFRLAVYCTLAVYVLYAIQVIRWMPLSTLSSGSDLEQRSLKLLQNEVGFHRVNMAMLLAGGSWALFCARVLPDSKTLFNLAVCLAALVFFAVGLTGGRTGFATWGVIALVFGTFKWKKVMILAPVCLAVIVTCVPAVKERMTKGFTEETIDTNVQIEELAYAADDAGPHMYTVSSGRTFAWGFVLPKIAEAPLFGYGREAMKTTGISLMLLSEYGESFPHPHNAYLEWIFDNGIIGFIPIFMFYFFVVRMSIRLLMDETNRYCATIGGVTLALVLALLIAAMGSQTFYPREGAVGMWCAIGLALRVYMQKQYLDRELRKTGNKNLVKDFWKLRDDRKPYVQYRHA